MKLNSSKYKSGEKALNRKEYEKLISVIDNIEDELLIKLAVSTGIRREDLCKVLVRNINIQEGTLTFHEAKKDRKEHLDKKGRKVEAFTMIRTVYLNPDIIVLIKKFLNTQEDRDKLFSFGGRTAYRHLNHWCRVASISERPFHALRATCVKFCQAAGWMPEEVSKLTGDTIRVIQEHYATPTDGDMKEVVQRKPII